MRAFRRALFVTPFAPTPPVEGHRKRMAANVAALRALGYRVDMLLLALEHAWLDLFDRDDFRAMRDMADGFHFVRGAHPPRLEAGSYGIDDWWHERFDDYAAWLFRNVPYELVFTNYVFTSRVLQHARPAAVRVIDTHDRFADRRAMLEAHGLRIEFFHTDAAGEAAGVARADLVLAIKEQEADHFRALGGAAVLSLPYAEPTAEIAAAACGRPVRFGYFASRNQINARNFLDFIDVAGPLASGLDIAAYGSVCDVLPDDPLGRYRRAGPVATPAEFYASVDCVIVPQNFSTGLKIKVGEALAFGRPIVAHAHAFEGFGMPTHPALGCPDFAAMVDWMRRLDREPALLDTLADATRTAQQRQQRTMRRSEAALGRFVQAARDDILVLVDGAAMREDRLYRCVIEGVTTAFDGRWRTVLAAVGGSGAEPIGGATALLSLDDLSQLEDGAGCGYAWRAALLLHAGPPPALGGVPCLAAPDVSAYLSRTRGVATVAVQGAVPLHGLYAHALGAVSHRVAWLRWPPLFVERTTDPAMTPRDVWLLCGAARRTEAEAMRDALLGHGARGSRVVCDDANDAGAVAEAYDAAMRQLHVPAGLIDLSDGLPAFALLREWLAMQHVPSLVLPTAPARDPFAEGQGVRQFLGAIGASRPAWRDRAPQPPSGASAGWDRVARTIAEWTIRQT